MITFRDKISGYEIKGILFKKTDDCYAVAVNGGIKLLRSDEWEEARDEEVNVARVPASSVACSAQKKTPDK